MTRDKKWKLTWGVTLIAWLKLWIASTYFAFFISPNPILIRVSVFVLSLMVFQGDVLYTMSALPVRYCSRSWIFIFVNWSLSLALPIHDMDGGSFGNTVTFSFKFIFSSRAILFQVTMLIMRSQPNICEACLVSNFLSPCPCLLWKLMNTTTFAL